MSISLSFRQDWPREKGGAAEWDQGGYVSGIAADTLKKGRHNEKTHNCVLVIIMQRKLEKITPVAGKKICVRDQSGLVPFDVDFILNITWRLQAHFAAKLRETLDLQSLQSMAFFATLNVYEKSLEAP